MKTSELVQYIATKLSQTNYTPAEFANYNAAMELLQSVQKQALEQETQEHPQNEAQSLRDE